MSEALLLELEGVLVETSHARRAALARAFRAEGFVRSAGECQAHPMTRPARECALAVLSATGEPADPVAVDLVAMRAEREFMRAISPGISLARGVQAFLEASIGRARLAIVTRASREETQAMLSLAALGDAFDLVITRDDVLDPRPSAAAHELALDRLARRGWPARSAALALEDSEQGVRAAVAAGTRAIAVAAEGLRAPDALASGASAFIESLEEQTPRTLAALVGGAPSARQERGA